MSKLIKNKHMVIFFILILGLILRLVAINQSLWLDEAIGAIAVRNFSYLGILTDFLKSDNHPPLYYLTLKAWANLFGYSETSLRMPSVIFGTLTVYFVYLIAKKLLKGKFFPYLSALFLATSPFHIYYSQEARMYSLAAFLATLAIYSFIKLAEKFVNRKRELMWWFVFSFSITALIFTDYVPVFLLPLFWVWAFIKKKEKKWWLGFILAHLPILVFGVLWLPIFLVQAEKGHWLLQKLPGWSEVAGGATFKQLALVWMKFVLGRISFTDKFFYYTLVGAASIPFLISLIKALKERAAVYLIWLWLLLPLTAGFLASFTFPAFIYFRFLYVIPAFFLLVSWGVTHFKSIFKIILASSLLLVNGVGWLIYVTEPFQQREHWREATAFVESKAKAGEIVIFEFPEPFAPYRWYAKGAVQAVGVTNSISADKEETVERTKRELEGKYGVYYYEYLRDLSDPDRVVEQTLRDNGFEASRVYDYFPGVGQITYWIKNKST